MSTSSTRADERARYTGKPVDRKPADGRCRYCGAPMVWIRSPDGKPQPCDPEVRTLVGEDGAVVRGHVSHWETCPSAREARENARERREALAGREAPRKAAAQPPVPARAQGRLALPGTSGDPLTAAAYALANATVAGHFDATVRSSIMEAVKHPRHELEVVIDQVNGYDDSTGRAYARWLQDTSRLKSLRSLRVDDRPLFVAIKDEPRGRVGVDGCQNAGCHVVLRIHQAHVAKFLAAAMPLRGQGEEG